MKIDRAWIEARIEDVTNGILPIPSNLHRATQALFWEFRVPSRCDERGITSIYNLTKRDHDGTLSMYQIYMQCANEYEAAIVLLGDYQRWERLCELPWFKPRVEEWRREAAVRTYAYAKSALVAAAGKGNAQAAQKLMDMSIPKMPVGRPRKDGKSKSDVKEEFIKDADRLILEEALKVAKGADNGTLQ